MYTGQALWTMAREGLDVTTVVVSNRSYAILNMELQRVADGRPAQGPGHARPARSRFGFRGAGWSMGVPATRAETAEEFSDQLARALATPGPNLVEAVITR